VNILDRYLYRTVLIYTAMAMGVLLTLGGLFLFITQQGDIGVGSYSAGDAFLFTLLNLPQQAFELLPIGAMIGALMGLGNLAAGSELVVTRASGVSVWRIAWPVGLAGLTLSLIMYGIGEYAAPPMAQFAKREKTTNKLADVSFAGSSSAWVKDGNLILRVQTGARSSGPNGFPSRTPASGGCTKWRRRPSTMIMWAAARSPKPRCARR
jgi:lipopolysaccharide export system permease protein